MSLYGVLCCVVSFCCRRLVAAWLLSLVVPGGAAMVRQPDLPLPDTVSHPHYAP
jgi:hypothetical protein